MTIEKPAAGPDASGAVPTLSRLGDHDLTVSASDEDIRGRAVRDRDGEVLGRVEGLLVDDVERRVRFMEVATGGFLGIGESRTLIPVEAITRIEAGEVHIGHTREHVAGAPRYDPQLTLERDASSWSGLYPYYGYGVWTAPWVTTWPAGQRGGGRTGA